MSEKVTEAPLGACVLVFRNACQNGVDLGEANQRAAEEWNIWARDLLARKADLIDRKEWWASVSENGCTIGLNAGTVTWLNEAKVVFSCEHWIEDEDLFGSGMTVRGWIFPGDVDFSNFVFTTTANFTESQFLGAAFFEKAVFKRKAIFNRVMFKGVAHFDGSTFEDGAAFVQARFEVARFSAYFDGGEAEFSGITCGRFAADRVEFRQGCDFKFADFSGDVNFQQGQFFGKSDFSDAKFRSDVRLADGIFRKGGAIFRGARWEHGIDFSNVRFDIVPDFIQSVFAQPPFLESATFPSQGGRVEEALRDVREFFCAVVLAVKSRRVKDHWDFGKGILRGRRFQRENPHCYELPGRYRALKYIAKSSGDWDLERDFSAKELIARRHVLDFPFFKNADRYWLGVFFGWVSNFGRSVTYPVICWVLSLFIFSMWYVSPYSGRGLEWGSLGVCVVGSDGQSAFLEGATYSLINGLVVVPESGNEARNRAMKCLFGESSDDKKSPLVSKRILISSTIQRVLSAAFFFLFGLGIRNSLRFS